MLLSNDLPEPAGPIVSVATYRVIFSSDSEVDAAVVSEAILEGIEGIIDADEGDQVSLTQRVTFNGPNTPVTAQEIADRLRETRNILIRTKIELFWETARELDKVIHVLESRSESDPSPLAGYDWGRMIDVTAKVLKGKVAID